MLIVHLFVSYVQVNLCHFSLPPDVRGWLRFVLVALPALFCLSFPNLSIMRYQFLEPHHNFAKTGF